MTKAKQRGSKKIKLLFILSSKTKSLIQLTVSALLLFFSNNFSQIKAFIKEHFREIIKVRLFQFRC